MTYSILLNYVVFGAMALLFIDGRVRYDTIALLALLTFTLFGLLTPTEAFSGFSSPAVVILFATYFVAEAIFDTGLSDRLGKWLVDFCKNSERLNILALMLVTGAISAIISNVATVIIMMPIAATVAKRAGISPSRLFLPISFAALLGGMTTLIGTSANFITSDVLVAHGIEGFQLFDFTLIGTIFLVVGIITLILLYRWGLPLRMDAPKSGITRIRDLYGLQERLFSLKVPLGSALSGRSLADLKFGSIMNLSIVEIKRPGEELKIPSGHELLRAGDVLLVRGSAEHFKRLMAIKEVPHSVVSQELLADLRLQYEIVLLEFSRRSLWVGKRIDDLDLPSHGIYPVAVEHNGNNISYDLTRHFIDEEDKIIAFYSSSLKESSRVFKELGITASLLIDLQPIRQKLLAFPAKPYIEALTEDGEEFSLSISLFAPLFRVTNAGIFPLTGRETSADPEDLLIMGCEEDRLHQIPHSRDLQIASESSELDHDEDEASLIEISPNPRSPLIGQTIGELAFRDKYGVQVLALRREGKAIRTGLTGLSIKVGDILLVYGSPQQLEKVNQQPDFIPLTELGRPPQRKQKNINLLSAAILFLLLTVTGVVPIHVAAVTTALFLVATKAVSVDRVYRNVDLRLVILIGALLPLGIAFDKSGAAKHTADLMYSITGDQSPYVVLTVLVLASSLISQFIDSSLAVVLLTPVAITTGEVLKISPYPLSLGIALGASIAFLAPFSHRAHLLVMGAGGYRRTDYLRIGLPLTLLLIVLTVLLVPIQFPF
jgi:di/tricarboxylate transporter